MPSRLCQVAWSFVGWKPQLEVSLEWFIKKLSRTCGIFSEIRHLLPTNVLVSLYNSLFASFLQYGIIVWGLTNEVHTISMIDVRPGKAITYNSRKHFAVWYKICSICRSQTLKWHSSCHLAISFSYKLLPETQTTSHLHKIPTLTLY